MRVNGNISPDVLSIENYEPIPGKVEVKLRENINEVEKTDEMTGETITLYEYDEYSFILDNEKNLKKKIQNHIEDWLTTGRTLEVAPNATLYMSAKSDAIDEYTNELIEEGLL